MRGSSQRTEPFNRLLKYEVLDVGLDELVWILPSSTLCPRRRFHRILLVRTLLLRHQRNNTGPRLSIFRLGHER